MVNRRLHASPSLTLCFAFANTGINVAAILHLADVDRNIISPAFDLYLQNLTKMMRFRRYRLYLAVALFSVALIFHLTRSNSWDRSSLEALVGLGTHHADKIATTQAQPLPELVPVARQEQLAEQPLQPAHPALPPVEPDLKITSTLLTSSAEPQPTSTGEELLAEETKPGNDLRQYIEGRVEVKLRPVKGETAHWEQQKEHFPVPSNSLRLLPSGEPKALPRVQHIFGNEKPASKKDRVKRQTIVREAFKHAWSGYKNHSLPHDELKPISKDFGDPFNGWGATLVDSLDTLWIMGLKNEFQDALRVVSKIDFRTSPRKDIPLFETVIRYLGGLIAAYDLSSEIILLDKAVELAEILLGAFDTPNRMPAVFYNWAPSYASQPHRANPHTVLAEIGSLSVEFTRLAQITKEHKYYDAIARITDALEEWQMKTSIPGLWPLKLDASGCKKAEASDVVAAPIVDNKVDSIPESIASEVLVGGDPEPGATGQRVTYKRDAPERETLQQLDKRQQLSSSPPRKETVPKDAGKTAFEKGAKSIIKSEWDEEDFADVDCEPQGLSTEPRSKTQTFGIGSMADSTYEYFPKEYALLGGLNTQYKSMYLDAMEVVREELLFRPMTKRNHDILFLAKKNISPKHKDPKKRKETVYEGTHLGCYAGGMFALGSKLFDIPSDMAIAERLADGCVWAYGSMPAGVMPEEFVLLPCESRTSCKWNEAKWHKALDPRLEERMEAVEMYNMKQQKLYEQASAPILSTPELLETKILSDTSLKKRESLPSVVEETATKTLISEDLEVGEDSLKPKPFSPMVPLSHEKYVAAKIQEERLPPGYTMISARDYRLRPEAIESVFIMYRLTGDESWREKGWAMFEAIDKATKTEIANAGVKDVTSLLQEQQDTMESFWLAETLKYFYLLFSEPDLISLDEYVL